VEISSQLASSLRAHPRAFGASWMLSILPFFRAYFSNCLRQAVYGTIRISKGGFALTKLLLKAPTPH
jgi:hypothetical protein